MDRNCPNSLCDFKYKVKKKPYKCPNCDAYIGGNFVPTPVNPKVSASAKVYRLGSDMYSVHTNQKHRTFCHIPSGYNTN